MAKDNNLQDFLTDIADAIREKKGTTEKINPQDFATEIANLSSGGGSGSGSEDNEQNYIYFILDDGDTVFYQSIDILNKTERYYAVYNLETWEPELTIFKSKEELALAQKNIIEGTIFEEINFDNKFAVIKWQNSIESSFAEGPANVSLLSNNPNVCIEIDEQLYEIYQEYPYLLQNAYYCDRLGINNIGITGDIKDVAYIYSDNNKSELLFTIKARTQSIKS